MPILSGNLASAVEVNKVFLGSSIINFCNLQKINYALYKKSYWGNHLTALGGSDYHYDGFGGDNYYDATNSTMPACNELQPPYIGLSSINGSNVSQRAWVCEIEDQFNDSTVDSNIWSTTGTVTEDTEKMTVASNSTAIADQTNATDYYAVNGDSEIVLTWRAYQNGSGGTTTLIQISDATNHVTVHTLTQSGGPPDDYYQTVRIVIDKTAEEARVAVGDGSLGSAVDISGAGSGGDGNWYIRFITATGHTAYIYFLGFVTEDSSGTVDLVTSAKTMLNTKDAGVLTWDSDADDADIAGYLSADSGSNYTSATKNTWTSIGTAGTGAKIKLTCNLPSTVDGTALGNIKWIKAVGAYFDDQ